MKIRTPLKASTLLAAPLLVIAFGTAACRQDEPQQPPPAMQNESPSVQLGEPAQTQRLADGQDAAAPAPESAGSDTH